MSSAGLQRNSKNPSQMEKMVEAVLSRETLSEQMGQAQQIMGVQHLMKMNRLQRKNQEAEAAAVRKAAWGEEHPDENEDDVGDTLHVGEQVTNNYTYQEPQRKSGVSPLAAALLGAAIPLAGGAGAIGAYLMAKDDPPPVVEPVDNWLGLAPPEEGE